MPGFASSVCFCLSSSVLRLLDRILSPMSSLAISDAASILLRGGVWVRSFAFGATSRSRPVLHLGERNDEGMKRLG